MSKSLHSVSCSTLPSRGCYTGMFTNEGLPDGKQISQIRKSAGGRFPLIMWYHAFAIGFDFPVDACQQVLQNGGTPFLRLEPWSWGGADDDSFPLEAINSGKFDSRIRRFASQSKLVEAPILMSFGHEMNVPFDKRWYPWGGYPVEYVAAFRRMVSLFREEGAHHVEWVYAVNEWDALKIPDYYPGREYVDWLGIDGFNFGDSQTWSCWRTFDQIFRPPYEQLAHLDPSMPILLAEFGCSEAGGDKAEWIRDALYRIPRAYPRIRAMVWFNIDKETDWQLESSEQALHAFRSTLAQMNGNYL